MRTTTAFTLIELLVVVTIIVVLLALLTPALDKAIYRAELVSCAAKERALGGGLITYATQYQRRYPVRTGLIGGGRRCNSLCVNWWPDGLPSYLSQGNGDDRPVFGQCVPINATFNCPLATAVNLENPDPNANVFTGYGLWFSWRFSALKGMYKLGDRFEFNGEWFRVLAADFETDFGNGSIQEAHPDKDGVLSNQVQDDVSAGFANRTYIASFWVGPFARGLTDRNFLFDDVSVMFVSDLTTDDTRLSPVPYSDYNDQTVARGSSNRDSLPAN